MTSLHALEAEMADVLDPAALRARHDAEMDIARALRFQIPDPADFASRLPLELCATLLAAQKVAGGIYKVGRPEARMLRPYGLCDYASTFLSAFGMQVRRALREEQG